MPDDVQAVIHEMGRFGAKVVHETREGKMELDRPFAEYWLIAVEGNIVVHDAELAREIAREIKHGITEARLRIRRRHGR